MLKRISFLINLILICFLLSNNLYSQFGKNKVQYEDFDWKYIETKHFEVFYNKGSKYLASFVAIEAENALRSIQYTLNFTINNKIIIIVYDTHNEFQQTNVIGQFMPEGIGGVTELFKNRVVIPFQGSYSQLRHVVHHELVHAVINDMLYGGTFQSALTTSSGIQFPLWMHEGLCEWESIGGMDTDTDMFMRDLTISEYLPPLERLNGYLAYRGGQTFYWYVAENYGEQRVGELINKLKVSYTLDAAFKSTFNMSLEEFSEKWQKDLKKYYWTDLDIFQDVTDFATAITDRKKRGNFYNSSPAISPDGDKVAYISDKKGIFSVFIQNIDDKTSARELVSSFRRQDFEDLNILTPGISWSPDGKRLAISAKAGGEDAVFLVDVATGRYQRLLFGLRSITSVDWSPDGDKLAFIGIKDNKSDIYVYKFSTDYLYNLTDDIFSDANPVWGPDSETIYFISDRGDFTETGINHTFRIWNHYYENSDIYSINLITKKIKRLTFDGDYKKTSIAISKDNNKLIFTSDKNGISNIYILQLSTGEIKPLTNSIHGITQLSLSRDESKLIFTGQVKAGYDLYLIRYPFNRELKVDSLPLTKFRRSWLEKRGLIAIKQEQPEIISEAEEIESHYGKFQVSFDNQQVIQPNPDVVQRTDFYRQFATKGENYSDTDFVERDYKIRFTPDLILGNPGYSTYWGFQGITQMLFSDVLGDHQIYILGNLLLDLRNSSFFVSYLYLPEVIDYQFSIFHSAGFVYRWYRSSISERPENVLFRFRNWGASIQAAYPFDLFTRVEWGLSWLNLSKENIDNPLSNLNVSRMLFVPEGRYVYDDVLYGMFAPVLGSRFYIGFKGTPKLSADGIGFMSLTGDFRHYIPLWDYLNLAIRGTLGASFGPNPQRFFLGGTENWINATFRDNLLPFDQPEDFAFMEFVMPLRGVSVNELNGSKFFLTNIEFRFPLFRALLAGPIPILFQSVMGAIFLDVGGAWDKDFYATRKNQFNETVPNHLLMSTGIGVRAYLLGLPLKLDVAWQNLYHNWTPPKYLISLGLDF